jgi:hypothetical protein
MDVIGNDRCVRTQATPAIPSAPACPSRNANDTDKRFAHAELNWRIYLSALMGFGGLLK